MIAPLLLHSDPHYRPDAECRIIDIAAVVAYTAVYVDIRREERIISGRSKVPPATAVITRVIRVISV